MRGRVLALLVILAVLLGPEPVPGKTYRWVDEHGNVIYSDRPPPDQAPAPEKAPPDTRPDLPPSTLPPGPAAPSQPPRAPTPAPRPPAPAAVTPPAPPPRTIEPARPAAPAPEAREPSAEGPAPAPMLLALAREIVELSGIDNYLDHLGNAAGREFYRLFWRLQDPEAAREAIAPLFRRDVMSASAVEVLARRIDAEHLPALLVWLRSPLHRKIRGFEVEAASHASYSRYREFVSRLPDTGIPPQRLSIVQQMVNDARTTELQIEMEHAVRRALRRALAPLVVSERGLEEDDVEEASLDESERTSFGVLTMAFFAYRSLTEAELEEYARFEASPAGVWAAELYRESLREAVRTAERRARLAIRTLAARRAQAR